MKKEENNSAIICPTCMVHLPSISKLSEHWKRFHSESSRLRNEDSMSTVDSSVFIASTETLDWRIFHEFTDSSLVGPSICDYCQEMMYSDAKQCQACDFICHSECEQMVVTLCDKPSSLTTTIGESTKESSVHIPRQLPSQAMNSRGSSLSQTEASSTTSKVRRSTENGKKNDELDVAYITDRFVVMSFPANGLESVYRQQLTEASATLKKKHTDNYMIFNVSERRYDLSKTNNQVLDFGWPDHLAPPLERLLSIVKSIDSWTSARSDNIAVIHCKGGKGRIGVVVSAFIQFSKLNPSPQAALDWFAMKSYVDNKFACELQPSQQRYIFYIGEMLEHRLKISKKPIVLRDLILHGIPHIEADGGCHPFFRVYQGMKLIATSDTYIASSDMERVCVRFDKGINLDGDVMIKCGQTGKKESGSDVIFRCQFHTDAVKDYGLAFDKSELDEACQDDRFPQTCQIEFIFGPITPTEPKDDTSGSDFEQIGRPYELFLKDPNNCVTEYIDGKDLPHGFNSMEANYAMPHGRDMFSGPHHIPGPVNGNPYAQIDPLMREQLLRQHKTPSFPVHNNNTINSKPSYEMDKGIQALEDLLGELGEFSQTQFQTPITDLNHNTVESKNIDESVNDFDKPALPSRQSSSYTAVIRLRHAQAQPIVDKPLGQVHSTSEYDETSATESDTAFDFTDAIYNNPSVYQSSMSGVNPESDDVFEATKSPPDIPCRQTDRNNSTDYDNENLVLERDANAQINTDAYQFQPGQVAGQIKHFQDNTQFPSEHSSTKPRRYGVPLPGLVKGVDCGDKISQFNKRSLAVGQCATQNSNIYTSSSPPRRVQYEHGVSAALTKSNQENDLAFNTAFIRAGDSMQQKEKRHILLNGHVPSGVGIGKGHHNGVGHGLLTTADFDYPCDKYEQSSPRLDTISGGDSAYGESMKSTSPLSSPICEQPPRMCNNDKSPRDFSSHSSSLTSIENDYAQIDDVKQVPVSVNKRRIEEDEITVAKVETKVESAAMLFDLLEYTPPMENGHSAPDSPSQSRLAGSPRFQTKEFQSHSIPKHSSRCTAGVKSKLSNSPRLIGKIDHSKGSILTSPRLLPKASHHSEFLSGNERHYARSQSNCSVSSDGSDSGNGCPGCLWVEQKSCHSSHSSSLNDSSQPEHTLPRTGRRRSHKSAGSPGNLNSPEFFREVLRYPNIRFDRETLDFWYRPKISREEATMLLRGKQPGTFVVRDSQSYDGAFGLAVKVSTPPLGIIQQAGGDLSKIDLNNELIRHFLIEPCSQGVRLKGNNNEPVFPSLVALIYQHSLTKLALPILLVIPEEDLVLTDSVDGGSESEMTVEQILFEKGAACNLVYLGVVDVEGLTGDGAVQFSVGKILMSATNSTAALTIINIKVNAQGITMTDNERKLFFRRHYNMASVLHAGVDPKERRIGLKDLVPDSSYQAACFGIVSRKPGKRLENECHVFSELDHDQPASAIISFIQKAMRYPKTI